MKVEIGATKIIYDFTQLQKEKITDELSLLNPAYTNAMKYSGYSRVNIPKYLHYYTATSSAISVPRGYNIPFEYEIVKDDRFELQDVIYPKFYIKLRKAQIEAANSYLMDTDKGVLVASTGLGKSILGIYLAKKLRQRALVIVQKDDLVSGWKNDIMLSLRIRPKQIGVVKAQEFRLGEHITITTIQTLSKLPKEKIDMLHSYFSMIILDEAHHAPAKSYDIVNAFPAKYRVALTATDLRNDGLRGVMTYYFGDVCYRYQDTNESTDIIPPKNVFIKIRNSNIQYNPPDVFINSYGNEIFALRMEDGSYRNIRDFSHQEINDLVRNGYLKRKSLDYHKAKEKIIENDEFNMSLAYDVVNEARNNKSCLVFFAEKDHCRAVRDKIVELGFDESRVQLYYGDSKTPKEEMKRKAETKEVIITIATYAIATEGTNVRTWERLFLGMSLGNEKDTIQAIGRGRRTCEGKKELIVYDYRHPGIKGIRGHGAKRNEVYKKLGFTYLNEVDKPTQNQMFTRGLKVV